MKNNINRIHALINITKIYVLFYLFIFVTLTCFKTYSLYTQSNLISANIRNNFLIGDRRSVEQVIHNSTKQEFSEIVITSKDGSYILNNAPSDRRFLLHFTHKFNSSGNANSDEYVIYFYFSILGNLISAFEIIIYLSIFLIPLYFYEIKKLQSQLEEEFKKERIQFINNLAIKVSHDIRSPIAALNEILNNSKIDSESKKLISLALKQINGISNGLLQDTTTLEQPFDIQTLIENHILLKRLEFNDSLVLDYYNSINEKIILVNAHETDIESIISNIINNSIDEISNPHISIRLFLNANKLYITFEDDGPGFKEEVLAKLGSECVSTKVPNQKSGSGIALLNAKVYLNSIGGEILFENIYPKGAKISLIFSKFQIIKSSNYILIDDDELTRLNWTFKARKSGVKLVTFNSADDFNNNIDSIDKDCAIYIDSELGDTKGEDLAIQLHEIGFSNLNMCTGHSAENFTELSFLKRIIDKTVPF